MIRKLSVGILVTVILVTGVIWFRYASFRSDHLDALASGSLVVETKAGPIEYELIGASGPFMLFLHGTPGGYDQLPPRPGYRVIAPSRPGYLRTPLEVGSTPTEQAHAYAALLDALGINSVVVIGASGGGPSSISFASLYPERTLALIAMEAVSQSIQLGDGQPEPPFFMRSDFLIWAALSSIDQLMGPAGIVKLLIPDPANQRRILDDPAKSARMEGLIWSIWPVSRRQAGMDNDLSEFAKLDLGAARITAPTLIVHGSEDINVPIDQSRRLARQIPGAVLHEIQGADHMMPFSHAEEVDATIERFLSALDLDRNGR